MLCWYITRLVMYCHTLDRLERVSRFIFFYKSPNKELLPLDVFSAPHFQDIHVGRIEYSYNEDNESFSVLLNLRKKDCSIVYVTKRRILACIESYNLDVPIGGLLLQLRVFESLVRFQDILIYSKRDFTERDTFEKFFRVFQTHPGLQKLSLVDAADPSLIPTQPKPKRISIREKYSRIIVLDYTCKSLEWFRDADMYWWQDPLLFENIDLASVSFSSIAGNVEVPRPHNRCTFTFLKRVSCTMICKCLDSFNAWNVTRDPGSHIEILSLVCGTSFASSSDLLTTHWFRNMGFISDASLNNPIKDNTFLVHQRFENKQPLTSHEIWTSISHFQLSSLYKVSLNASSKPSPSDAMSKGSDTFVYEYDTKLLPQPFHFKTFSKKLSSLYLASTTFEEIPDPKKEIEYLRASKTFFWTSLDGNFYSSLKLSSSSQMIMQSASSFASASRSLQ